MLLLIGAPNASLGSLKSKSLLQANRSKKKCGSLLLLATINELGMVANRGQYQAPTLQQIARARYEY